MNPNAVILLIVICLHQYVHGAASLVALPAKEEVVIQKSYCTMDRVYRLLGYDCSNMNLKEVPQNLRTSVEVFDISFNRIREITKKSFAQYPDIKFLYLFDNMIQHIEKGAFAHLTSLEAIDLSINGLATISMDLFQLPRLRNLYYNENVLIHLTYDLKTLNRPIAAPLQKINLAGCRLSSIPDFGILPELVHLNVSYNSFDQITPQQFSPFCSLTTIVIENSTDLSPCMCKSLITYFDRRNIRVKDSFDCPRLHEEVVYCEDASNATIDTSDYGQCMTRVKERELDEKSKKTWFSVVCTLAAFFVIFICILYYFHRRNVKRIELEEKQSTKLRHIHRTDVGNVEVLLTAKT